MSDVNLVTRWSIVVYRVSTKLLHTNLNDGFESFNIMVIAFSDVVTIARRQS